MYFLHKVVHIIISLVGYAFYQCFASYKLNLKGQKFTVQEI